MKRSIALTALLVVLVLVAGLVLPGCSSQQDIVVGKVYGENITAGDVDFYVGALLAQYDMHRSTDITDEEMMKSINESALSMAVTLKILLKKAKEKGLYPLSAENAKAVEDDYTQYLDARLQTFVTDFTEQAAADTTIDPQKAAQSALDKQLIADGFGKQDILRFMTESTTGKLVYEDAIKDVSVSDEDVQHEYDALVASQKESYTSDAALYESDKSSGETTIVYAPAGYRYIKHILLSMPQDISDQMSANMSDTAKVRQLREQGLAMIKEKADLVLTKAQAGEDFDALVKQYGEDPGMQQEPYITLGYEVGTASSFVEEFRDSAMALAKVGDISGLVATDYGYHIIKYVSDVPFGPVPLTDVKDAIKSTLLETKKTDTWDALLEQWRAEAKAETYPDKIPVVMPSVSPSPSASVSASDEVSPSAAASPSASPSSSQ